MKWPRLSVITFLIEQITRSPIGFTQGTHFEHSLFGQDSQDMVADDERTYVVPSLLKTAYYACDKIRRDMYDELEVPDVDMQICCESLFQIVKLNTDSGGFDSLGDRRSTKAASHGHIDCLKFAREIGFPWYTANDLLPSACTQAARKGNLECLVYAHENGSPWDCLTSMYAAMSGKLTCLRYVHENGCPWDDRTCTKAAETGRLDCLMYAHRNGCAWDEFTCAYAAHGGHLDCLTYAHENGCPWDKITCSNAVDGGHLNCLTYALENGCPWDADTPRHS
ncbi:uncharacterized protein LOC115034136 [Acyrthosiphon pisum]|uniref:Uncharacterized protein n=1 Tax=Acyrthosiphon pisum TaxID=7029 RepID=A0A8R2NQN1_ACYPI|nr:uncharacterized protein LOC115034136 [Acyrthosiphon pisum]